MVKRNQVENLTRTFLLLSLAGLLSMLTACAGGEGVVSPEGALVTPNSFPEETPTVLTITGANFLPGSQVSWNGKVVPSTFVSPEILTITINQPTPGKFPITVTNPTPNALPTAKLIAEVMPGQDVVEIQRENGASVRVNDTLKFSTTVTGTTNTGVTWQLNGNTQGNSQIGTFVVNTDGSVTYTAPAVVPTPNTVTLTATSVDNPADEDNRLIEILNPIPTLASVTPSTTNPGTTTFVLNGTNFLSNSQLLVNGAPVSVSYKSSGQLTASLSLPTPGPYYFQVANPDPGYAPTVQFPVTVSGTPPAPQVTPAAASRFLDQATFGATPADIQNLSNIGYQAWFTQQFNTAAVSHVPYIQQELIRDTDPGTFQGTYAEPGVATCAPTDQPCNYYMYQYPNGNISDGIFQSFFMQAVNGKDQLRQRVAYSLSQFLVISNNNGGATHFQPRGFGAYLDVLENDAFGNFRTLLQDVTLNAQMGQFLSIQGNEGQIQGAHPDENYAREVMQLFTIGLYKLNMDGTLQVDGSGNPIPTYGLPDVEGLASVFTGFSYNVPAGAPDNYTPNASVDWSNGSSNVGPNVGFELLPMKSYPTHHSTAEKDFLGVVIPAGQGDPDADLKVALDTLFNHPNTPPFVCKQLIQHMVKSDPSPAYVQRVATVFVNDGTGVRGNMQAVIKAILLDPEATNAAAAYSNNQSGKVRESLIRYLEWARAFNAQSYTGVFEIGTPEAPDYGLGEMALRSPTVFNWFTPGYVPPNTSISQAGLVAPELQMTTVVATTGYLNYMENAVGASSASFDQGGPDVYSNYVDEIPLANNPQQLINHLSLLLLGGNMSSTLQGELLTAINSVAIPSGGDQADINQALLTRVQVAVFITVASPEFAAQI